MLTVQGHPELDSILSRLFVATDDLSSFLHPELEMGRKGLDAPHDGEKIFATIMKWASGDVGL